MSEKMESLLVFSTFVLCYRSRPCSKFSMIFLLCLCQIVGFLKIMSYMVGLKKFIKEEKLYLFRFSLKPHYKSIQNHCGETCTICYENIDENDLCELNFPCHSQFYHQECIKKWIFKNPTCPVCRENVYK